MLGAVLNAIGGSLAHIGFGIWIVSNTLFIGYFAGVYGKLWVVNSDSKHLILMYGFFLCTAGFGFYRG